MEKLCAYFKCFDDPNKKEVDLLRSSQTLLKYLGLGASEVNIKAFLRFIPIILVYNTLQFGQLGHLVHYINDRNGSEPVLFFDIADDISTLLTCNTANYIAISLMVYSPSFSIICCRMGDFTDPDLGRALGIDALDQLFIKFLKGCIAVFVGFGFLSWLLYFLERCEPGEVSTCGFLFMPYLPFVNVYNQPWRGLMLIGQVISGYSCGLFTMINISQYMFLNEVLIARYKHMFTLIEGIPKLKPSQRRALIGQIVRYHTYLISVNRDINKSMGHAYALHLCVTPLNMSVILYQLIGKEIMISSVLHILSYVFVVIITCGSGERLTTNTELMHEKIFNNVPFDDVHTMKDMQFMLLQAQSPLKIQAGGVANVNHVLSVGIFKTVWSILTLLLKTH